MKKFTLILSSYIIFFSVGFSQKRFSLEEAINYARINSNTLNIERTNIQDVDGQIKEYYAIGLPKLSGSLSYNYFIKLPTSIFPNFITPAVYDVLFDENLLPRRDVAIGAGVPVQFGTKNNLTAGLELSTLLFDGSFFVGLKAQRLYRDLILKQINQSESELKYQVTKAYLAALAIAENQKLVQKNISNLENVKNELSQIYTAGLIEKLDVDRVELSLQNLITENEKLERIAIISMNVLKFQMNYPLSEALSLSENLDAFLTRSYLEIMDPSFKLNIEERPEYPVIMQGIRLAEINIKRYKVAYLPSLYGFASYQQSLQRTKLFDSNDNNWFPTSTVGLNLNVPIFDGFDKKAKISRAKTLLNKSNLQYKQFESAVHLEFENARTQYLNASLTIDSRKKSLALAQRIYDTSKIKFKEGVGSSLEVTSAERDVYLSQANLLEAQVNLIQAKVDLDKSLGKL
ncbi:MAG: TolC family protein [Saprospiraceae bacterium]|nr:TolC family protein [Saprospiraceae bacterium]MBK9727633.1 TolC family protein [Saprospiraceae bacterium]